MRSLVFLFAVSPACIPPDCRNDGVPQDVAARAVDQAAVSAREAKRLAWGAVDDAQEFWRDLEPVLEDLEKASASTARSALPEFRPIPGTALGISCDGHECQIRRGFIRTMSERRQDLLTHAQVVPELDGVSISGLRLMNVQPQGVPYAVGFRTGDVITSVAESPVRSIGDLVKLGPKLRGRERIPVTLHRGEQVQTIVLRAAAD